MALHPEVRPEGAPSSAAPPSAKVPEGSDPLGVKPTPKSTGGGTGRIGDRLFKSVAIAAGSTIVIAIALIAIFLLIRAVPSLRVNHANFFTSAVFDTNDADNLAFGIRDLFMVTVLSSVYALALADPESEVVGA
jgi:phosphate transport system permease protein